MSSKRCTYIHLFKHIVGLPFRDTNGDIAFKKKRKTASLTITKDTITMFLLFLMPGIVNYTVLGAAIYNQSLSSS